MKKFGWTVWGLVGFIFAPIGLLFLLIGLLVNPVGPFLSSGDMVLFTYTFIGMGLLFLSLGLTFLYFDLRRRHRLRQAYYSGYFIDAKILAVRENLHVTVNGRHPFVIECAYTDAYGAEHLYKSRNLYSFPGEDLIGKTVPVYVDRTNEDIGFVDTDAIF